MKVERIKNAESLCFVCNEAAASTRLSNYQYKTMAVKKTYCKAVLSNASVGHEPRHRELNANAFIIKKGEEYILKANLKFLEEAVARGDKFIFSSSYYSEKVASLFKQEVDYILSHNKGYRLASDGMSLIK